MNENEGNPKVLGKLGTLDDRTVRWAWAYNEVESVRDMSYKETARWLAEGASVSTDRADWEIELCMGGCYGCDSPEWDSEIEPKDAWLVQTDTSFFVVCEACAKKRQEAGQ